MNTSGSYAAGLGAVIGVAPSFSRIKPPRSLQSRCRSEQRFSLVTVEDRNAALACAVLHHSPGNPEPGGLLRLVVKLEAVLGIVFCPYPAYGTVTGCWTSEWAAGVPALAPLCPSAKICRVFDSNGSDGSIREHDAERVLIVDRTQAAR